MKQYSCSELLVDFHMDDVDKVYKLLEKLTEKYNWNWEPKLNRKNLERVRETNITEDYGDRFDMEAYDKDGNYITLSYGNNGYDKHTFYFDADQHVVKSNFPFLDKMLKETTSSELKSYDGGTTRVFDRWR